MIFKEKIQKQTPKACEYFEKIFINNASKLSPSIILFGDNEELNYEFATEIARALNCEKDKSDNCDCLNCRWIRGNEHPAVKTFSNIESKYDNSKTVISIDQAHAILDEIVISSDYKRVYIFCAAEETRCLNDNGEQTKKIIHKSLNKKVLPAGTANALLKSIEEPPSNTYFIFIARDKDDVLQTIVSRSQAFYIHSEAQELPQINGLDEIFRFYPFNDYPSTKEFTENLNEWQNNNNLDTATTLCYAQEYLQRLLESNISDKYLTNTITSDIFKFENAKKMVKNNFKDYVIYENLTYKLYKD